METRGPALYLLQKRWILAYIVFFGYFCQYLHRTNFNLAIVCMVRTRIPEDYSNTRLNGTVSVKYMNGSSGNSTSITVVQSTLPQQPPVEEDDTTACGEVLETLRVENERAEFDWEKALVSGMLSSYYYGVIVTQVLGGYAAIRLGGKTVIVITMATQGLCCLLIPSLTRLSFVLLFVMRVLTGLAAGGVSPAFFTIWTKWAPPDERGKLLNFSILGGIIGVVLSFSTSGLLCAYGFDRGWGSIFYIHGMVTAVFLLIWLAFVSDSPAEHPSISEAEKEYIAESLGNPTLANNRKDVSVPWGKILTSPAVLVLAVAHTCYNWINFTILTMLPLYMKEVLKFDIKQNGMLSSIPHICYATVTLLVGILSDVFIRKRLMSTTVARRVFQGLSFIGLSICMFIVTLISCEHKILAVVMMCIGTGFLGVSQGGYYLNAVDFAPRYSGVIYGLTNSISCTTGTIAPLVAGLLTAEGTRSEWNNVFYVCIGVSFIGLLVFSLFSRSEVQSWAREDMSLEVEQPQLAKLKDRRFDAVMVSSEFLGSSYSLHSIQSVHSHKSSKRGH